MITRPPAREQATRHQAARPAEGSPAALTWPGREVTRLPGGPHTGDDVAAHAGEVRVNVGGEPDRDDFGLPPVDIEIPDDARELDRDVQAYRRELRALRRQGRVGRLRTPLTRDGLVLPLLAGCLAMVLITGVLLTLFSAGQSGARQLSSSARPTQNASISQRASQLPDATVITASGPVPLRTLFSAVLTLVPPGCRCRAALRQLGQQATAAGVSLYLVGTSGDMPQVRRLAASAPQPGSQVADDPGKVLARRYRARGLTAVLVRADDSVEITVRNITVRNNAAAGSPLPGLLRSLSPAGP